MTPLIDPSLAPYRRIRATDATGHWGGNEMCLLVDRNDKPVWATWGHSSRELEDEVIDAMAAVANAGGWISVAEPWEWPKTLGPVVGFANVTTGDRIRIGQMQPPTLLMEIIDPSGGWQRLATAVIELWNEGSTFDVPLGSA